MASSFSSQIPIIIYLIKKLNPQKILDIGKGFGKYGFLIHEYFGIETNKKIDKSLTLKEQSKVIIDAVEVDDDLMLPHLNQIYNKIYIVDIFDIYRNLESYDLILMIDVIEHLEKEKAKKMLIYFLSIGHTIIIATPKNFFAQHLYESSYENHISHWSVKDFKEIGKVDYQYTGDGVVYLVSSDKHKIVGFGNSLNKKVKRILRIIINEVKS